MMNKSINSDDKWRFDPWILGISLSLLLVGLIMVASSSISIADHQNGQPFYFLYRQLIAVGIGIFGGAIVIHTPIRLWQEYGFYLMGIAILMLILVLIPGVGKQVNGSFRWIPLGIFNLQVSEVVKLVFVIYLAGFLVRRNELIRASYKGLIIPMGILTLVALLLLLEPDLGATAVIFAIALGMLFIAGVPVIIFVLLSLLALVAGILLVIFEPYRAQRLKGFWDPWADPYGTGYHLSNSLMALGRGDWFGVGLGNSIQKLFYLPEAHTDFIFAILVEELGLLGAILIIVLFLALVGRIFFLATRAFEIQKFFESYMLFGFGIWIGVQAFVNIGVNIGVLPTKGLTLPLISYGGSSILIMCIVIALILRVELEMRFK